MLNLFPYHKETYRSSGFFRFYGSIVGWYFINAIAFFMYAAAVCLAVKAVL